MSGRTLGGRAKNGYQVQRRPPKSAAGQDTNPAADPAAPPQSVTIPAFEKTLATIKVVGVSPLVIHHFGAKARRMMLASHLEPGGRRLKAKHEPRNPVDEYNEARYISTDGWDGIRSAAFKAAMVAACRQVDKLPMVLAKGLFFVEGDGYTADGYNLTRIEGTPTMREDYARNKTGTVDLRFRPQYMPWACVLSISFNPRMLALDGVINLLQIAGWSVGVGEMRPGAPLAPAGEFGRFKVAEMDAGG